MARCVLARWSGLSVDFTAVKTLHPATLARKHHQFCRRLGVLRTSFAQQSVTDLKSLVGKKAIAQRMPLYEPGHLQGDSEHICGTRGYDHCVQTHGNAEVRP